MKAIVLTCDRYRAITEHMMLKYEEVWPDHPFQFRIPYQDLPGINTPRAEFIHSKGSTPAEIPDMILDLISDLHDEEWLYWCLDDKYPIQLAVDKIRQLMDFAISTPDISGLLFCRTRFLMDRPAEALLPHERVTPGGDVLFERRAWHQIWIHQLLRVKVLRNLFINMPRQITAAKSMEPVRDRQPKPENYHLFVTKENFAVFGESTHRGKITRNCLESIRQTGIDLPGWFQQSNGESIILGEMDRADKGGYFGNIVKRIRRKSGA